MRRGAATALEVRWSHVSSPAPGEVRHRQVRRSWEPATRRHPSLRPARRRLSRRGGWRHDDDSCLPGNARHRRFGGGARFRSGRSTRSRPTPPPIDRAPAAERLARYLPTGEVGSRPPRGTGSRGRCRPGRNSVESLPFEITAKDVERSWSPAVTTGGNRWQMRRRQDRRNRARNRCDGLPPVAAGSAW
jgi:hypothetical protein